MSLRVVVVDDDFRLTALHRAYVERVEGFEVVAEAHSGAAALTAVEKTEPDLLLLDIYLPDISGLEVLRRIRQPGRAQTDVVVITAARDAASVRTSLQGGSLTYLMKPFTFARLQEVLEAYRSMRLRLAGAEEVTQTEVDELYAALRSAPRRDLPKGHSPQTLGLIVETLRASGEDLSCEEVAQRAGLSRATAQRYLSHLARIGRVELSLRYGGGRPEHRYRWP
ncbi:MAG: response regulator [Actinomycetota bacterium]|nr:response regulator [Actinomycetota bacterium]